MISTNNKSREVYFIYSIEIIHKSIVNFVTHHAHVIFFIRKHTRAHVRACSPTYA